MIDREHRLSVSRQATAAWDQSGQRLLPAPASFHCRRSGR